MRPVDIEMFASVDDAMIAALCAALGEPLVPLDSAWLLRTFTPPTAYGPRHATLTWALTGVDGMASIGAESPNRAQSVFDAIPDAQRVMGDLMELVPGIVIHEATIALSYDDER